MVLLCSFYAYILSTASDVPVLARSRNLNSIHFGSVEIECHFHKFSHLNKISTNIFFLLLLGRSHQKVSFSSFCSILTVSRFSSANEPFTIYLYPIPGSMHHKLLKDILWIYRNFLDLRSIESL